jgi:hypothetical protein
MSQGPWGRGGAAAVAIATVVNMAPISVSADPSISTSLILGFIFILICLISREAKSPVSDLKIQSHFAVGAIAEGFLPI